MNRFFERPFGLWLAAVVLTLCSVLWQRMSGPTYPVRGKASLGTATVSYKFLRSHSTNQSQPVEVKVANGPVSGVILWRRYPLDEPWGRIPMRQEGELLRGLLPAQPPAGKLEYQVLLTSGAETALLPPRPAVTRFKGDVPPGILIPHIVTMFGAMLWSTATGLKALSRTARLERHAWGTFVLIAIGGFLLGPLVQKAAFGKFWTGFPYGHDLTDNKTLIAGVFWALALVFLTSERFRQVAVVSAALVTLIVFAIPHSLFGSEIDWKKTNSGASASRPVSASRPLPTAEPWHGGPGAPALLAGPGPSPG